MKATKYEGDIDITGWDFPDWNPNADKQSKKIDKMISEIERELEKFKGIVVEAGAEAINKTLVEVFERDGVEAEIHEGDIAFGFPMGAYEGDLVYYKASLSDLVDGLIEEVEELKDDDAHSLILAHAKRSRDAMQKALDKLSAYIDKEGT